MIISEDDHLAHYGILRKSGRYPWGSGGPETNTGNRGFLEYVDSLKKKGMSEPDIAKAIGTTTTALRAAKSIAKNEEKQALITQAQRLKDHGYSTSEIGRKMSMPESSIRGLLAPGAADKADRLKATADMLKDAVARKTYIDVGTGVEQHLQISTNTLNNAVARLKEEGYEVHNVKIPQIMGNNQKTEFKVLCPPGTEQSDVWRNREKITQQFDVQSDGKGGFLNIKPPLSISSKRVQVVYGPDGGDKADGVIYVRPGVKDISMGEARYAQVRIAVDGTHYLKGMAVYKDDLPDGVDLQFNTNKKSTGNKLDAMKALKDDPDNPFGSIVRQRLGLKGEVTSALNIVGTKPGSGEEGAWDQWSKTLSSQFLSKQSPTLAKSQLNMAYEAKRNDLNEIMALTNPAVKKKLLESFADGADSASWHLKAAKMPRQRNQVILPINSLKPTEVYAPRFRDGERVVLVRFPHGGTFEIPELTVNNRNREGRRILGTGEKMDAIGIHHKVAEQLSGADFDGDTVLVLPNNQGKIKTKSPLKELTGFNPQMYKLPDDIPRMKAKTKGIQMGMISNLITDMTIKGATDSELARAVRHSMVVIDAEKHHLNYKQSAIDNGISALQKKYQVPDSPTGKAGAATIISRRKREIDVPDAQLRKQSKGGPIDPKTGNLIWEPTGATKVMRKVDKRTGEISTTTVPKTMKVGALAWTHDAHILSTGLLMENIYADHSNAMKDLANIARREYVGVQPRPYSPSAKKAYAAQVDSLDAKYSEAVRNRPLERQAQLVANANIDAMRAANPDMDSAELKKIKGAALVAARVRLGAGKTLIHISDDEWKAVQAGAISNHRLEEILKNADLDRVRELATPRSTVKMTPIKVSRARQMVESGYTQSEIADALGVSISTIQSALSNK